MAIQFHYLDYLLLHHHVDEVHIWDFCGEREEDREFLMKHIHGKPKLNYVYFSQTTNNHKNDPNARNADYLWGSYYEHYSNSSNYADEDILIKGDDDIVFMDVKQFPHFVANVKTPNLYFPNIVNNDAGLFIQHQRQAHPSILHIVNNYTQLGINLQDKFTHYLVDDNQTLAHEIKVRRVCPLTSPVCTAATDYSWDGGLFTRGDYADMIHEGFLANPMHFCTTCQNHFFARMIALKQRISINLYAGRMILIRELFRIFLEYQCCGDEGFVGKWPTLTHFDHFLDSHFTIVHYAFHSQYEHAEHLGIDLNRFLSHYEALAKKMVNPTFSAN